MAKEQTTLEIIAPSVEEAVSRGLSQLGLPRESVEVEVLDSGSKGLFGLGGRQARIRLTVISPSNPEEKPAAKAEGKLAKKVETEERVPAKATTMRQAEPNVEMLPLQISQRVVRDLLERMKVRAVVDAHYVEPQDAKDQLLVQVEIQGDDLSILIGRRSETLNALQYLTNLIVAKELGHWVPLSIDVQGYRSRRERQLRQLARRMAEQALHTGRRQVLEPMPPNERRLIHLELRDNPDVETESTGEEPARKVTIFPKK